MGNAFIFYLPVFVSNVGVYFIASMVSGDIPLDRGKTFMGGRIISDSRTVGGFSIVVLLAVLTGILQGRAIQGLYLGVGSYAGMIGSSFIKRRLGMNRGKESLLLDHVDVILGSSLFYVSAYQLPIEVFISGLCVGFTLHLFVNLALRPRYASFIHRRLHHGIRRQITHA